MDTSLLLTEEDIRKESFHHTPIDVPHCEEAVVDETVTFEDLCKATDEFHKVCEDQTRQALREARAERLKKFKELTPTEIRKIPLEQ